MLDIITSVDLTLVLSWIIAIGVLIIGIALSFAGIVIGKRAVNIIGGSQISAEDRPENWDEDHWNENYAERFERDQERYRN